MPTKKKTEDNKDEGVRFQISKIETLQYALLSEKVDEKSMQFQAGFGFGIDPESKMVRCSFEYTFLSGKEPVLKIETALQFAIEPACFEKQIDQTDKWTIPKGFAIHAAMITVSTTRGILHEKTINSSLNNYPLQIINVLNTVQEDIVIDKEVVSEKKMVRNKKKSLNL